MKIKICGLKRIEDIYYVNHAMPDWIGFVFAGKKRKIDFDTAYMLKKALKPEIASVGVFVNEEHSFVMRLVENEVVDMVQLHGDETEDYILTLRSALEAKGKGKTPIIKAVRVKDMEQVLEAEHLSVDYLLLDAFTAEEYGGSGKVFDHKLIPNLTKPYILAGGIGSENVKPILHTLSEAEKLPICVDVSSAVEINGFKDEQRILEMVSAVRQMDESYITTK